MSDIPEYWYQYIDAVGVKVVLNIRNWKLWEPDFKEVEKLP